MIDISDGLALDLHRLADASSVGFRLDEVPAAGGATLEDALGGGEDYELLIAVGGADEDALSDTFGRKGFDSPPVSAPRPSDPALRLFGDGRSSPGPGGTGSGSSTLHHRRLVQLPMASLSAPRKRND